MSRCTENTGFKCENCGQSVVPLNNGSFRNHCPFCLFSKHVDNVPGDRGSDCGGLMSPVGVEQKPGKGFQLIHACFRCGRTSRNRIAENTDQPDEIGELIRWF